MLGLLLGALAVGALCGRSDVVSIYKEKEYTHDDIGKLVSFNYRNVYHVQSEKVEFYDDYRELDNYLARFIGEGSGWIGLLINACKFQDLQNYELKSSMEQLREVRGYRCNLSHNKSKWKYLPNPKSYYSSVMIKIRSIANRDYDNVSRALYKQAMYSKSRKEY